MTDSELYKQMAWLLKQFQPMISEPATRLERLTVAVVQSPGFANLMTSNTLEASAELAVQMAVLLDIQLASAATKKLT